MKMLWLYTCIQHLSIKLVRLWTINLIFKLGGRWGCSDFLKYDKKLNKGFAYDEWRRQNIRLCKFPKFFDSYYNMSNIPVHVYVIVIFLLAMCLGSLSFANVEPKLIFIEENIQEYFKVSLQPLSCCMFK